MLAVLALLSCTSEPLLDDSGGPLDDTDASPSAMEQNLASAPGDYALDLLRPAPYDRLVIEVDYVAGNAPEDSALDALVDAVEELCDKPGGVELILDDEIEPQGSPAWSVRAAEDLEVSWRDRYRSEADGDAALYLLYLDGNHDGDDESGEVLGYAYHGSSLVLFKETIEAAGSGLPLAAEVEDVVIVHELGHALGLVNNGIPMVEDHQDEDHGKHDDNEDCVMYWAAETDAISDMLGTSAPTFDEACRQDIAAAGGLDTTR